MGCRKINFIITLKKELKMTARKTPLTAIIVGDWLHAMICVTIDSVAAEVSNHIIKRQYFA